MQELRQGTAIKVRVGDFVDIVDGRLIPVAVTLAGADEAELLKHNGAATVSIAANTWAAVTDCDGWYDLTLSTDDTDTLGMLTVVVQDDDVCLPVHIHFAVITQQAWDSKYSTDTLQVDVTQIGGVAQSATDLKHFADSGYDPSTGKITGTADMRGTEGAALASAWTGTRAGYVDKLNVAGTLANTDNAASFKADVSGLATTAGLGTLQTHGDAAWATADVSGLSTFDPSSDPVYLGDGAHGGASATLTLVSYADFRADVSALAIEAKVQGHVADALVAYDPPTKAELDTAVASLAREANVATHAATGAAAALAAYDPPTKGELDSAVSTLAIEANVQGHVADALVAYDPPTKAELDTAASTLAIEANVATHAATGAAAALASYDPPTKAELDSAVSPLAQEANVQGHAAAALIAYDPPTDAEMDAGFAAVSTPPSAATIADAVLDEALSGHTTAGTAGKAVSYLDRSISIAESNIRGADADTLKTLSDQVDSVEIISGDLAATITEATLDTDGTALGTVQDNLSNPLAGATVAVYADADTGLTTALYQGTSDGDGGFSITVIKGATYRIVPIYSGYTFETRRATV